MHYSNDYLNGQLNNAMLLNKHAYSEYVKETEPVTAKERFWCWLGIVSLCFIIICINIKQENRE